MKKNQNNKTKANTIFWIPRSSRRMTKDFGIANLLARGFLRKKKENIFLTTLAKEASPNL